MIKGLEGEERENWVEVRFVEMMVKKCLNEIENRCEKISGF